MKPRFYAALLAVTVIGCMSPVGAEPRVAAPSLPGTQVLHATGTVEMVHAKQGTVVINDREYLLSPDSTSAKTATRGARVDFSYRESQPLPVITEISTRR